MNFSLEDYLRVRNCGKSYDGSYVSTSNRFYYKQGVHLVGPIESSRFDFCIKKVIYNDPATIILWKDGTKTVVKCDEHDTYDPEKGLYIAIMKKLCGNRGKFYKEAIEPWLPKKEEKE